MSHRHHPARRALRAAAVAAALTAAAVLPPAAAAAPAPAGPDAAAALTARLGDRAAGAYYDTAGRLVVDITDTETAAAVRAAGALPRTVPYSLDDLRAATADLTAHARIPGTAWSVDPRTDRVVVTADRTVTASGLARLRAVAGRLGGRVAVRRIASAFRPYAAGGDAVYGGMFRCSVGFNVTVHGAPAFLTAGHCGTSATSWTDALGGEEIGRTADARFPGSDFALVTYDDPHGDHPSTVDLFNGGTQAITHAAEATVGERVTRSGSTSGIHRGTVTGVNVTVNYPEGTVGGLIETDVCSEAGDSGGALFDGTAAIGLTSGGNGDCLTGGQTYFQPVTAALRAEGAVLG